MRIGLGRLSLVLALAISTFTAATTAEARDYYRRGNDDAALAIGAGLVGLAVGAAIASDHHDRYYYRDRPDYRYYPDTYYYPERRYYRYRPERYYRYRPHEYRDYRPYRYDRGYYMRRR